MAESNWPPVTVTLDDSGADVTVAGVHTEHFDPSDNTRLEVIEHVRELAKTYRRTLTATCIEGDKTYEILVHQDGGVEDHSPTPQPASKKSSPTTPSPAGVPPEVDDAATDPWEIFETVAQAIAPPTTEPEPHDEQWAPPPPKKHLSAVPPIAIHDQETADSARTPVRHKEPQTQPTAVQPAKEVTPSGTAPVEVQPALQSSQAPQEVVTKPRDRRRVLIALAAIAACSVAVATTATVSALAARNTSDSTVELDASAQLDESWAALDTGVAAYTRATLLLDDLVDESLADDRTELQRALNDFTSVWVNESDTVHTLRLPGIGDAAKLREDTETLTQAITGAETALATFERQSLVAEVSAHTETAQALIKKAEKTREATNDQVHKDALATLSQALNLAKQLTGLVTEQMSTQDLADHIKALGEANQSLKDAVKHTQVEYEKATVQNAKDPEPQETKNATAQPAPSTAPSKSAEPKTSTTSTADPTAEPSSTPKQSSDKKTSKKKTTPTAEPTKKPSEKPAAHVLTDLNSSVLTDGKGSATVSVKLTGSGTTKVTVTVGGKSKTVTAKAPGSTSVTISGLDAGTHSWKVSADGLVNSGSVTIY